MKKVFKIKTTNHINAAPNQDYEIHQWLIGVLSMIAQRSKNPNGDGEYVDVIVEVLDA